jgi:hypothetical protein
MRYATVALGLLVACGGHPLAFDADAGDDGGAGASLRPDAGGAGASGGAEAAAGTGGGSGGLNKKPGEPCVERIDCQSSFCVDGVCCNTACEGLCVSCASPDAPGTCVPVSDGIPDPRGVCVTQDVATCGTTGSCDGHGACAIEPANAVCAPATCMGATLIPPRSCDGLGTCLPAAQGVSCASLMCGGAVAQCLDNCPGGDAICIPGSYCSGNEACAPRKASGVSCRSDHECSSGKCLPALEGAGSSCR